MCRTTQCKRGVRTVSGRVTAVLGGGLLLAAGFAGAVAALPAPRDFDPHTATVAALDDIQAAVGELQKASDSNLTGAGPFRKSAHRAINDLVGEADPRFDKTAGSSADANGALVHLAHVLHDSQSQPWVTPVTSAKVNVQAAVGSLQNALDDDELQSFMLDASDALTHLDVAIGRASGSNAFGGLRGALANTVLGIPLHARVTSGCSELSAVPAYGVKNGYVIYVAVPVSGGKAELPGNFSSSQLTVSGKRLVAYTAAAHRRSKLCGSTNASTSVQDQSPLELTAAAGFVRVVDSPVRKAKMTSAHSTAVAKASEAMNTKPSSHYGDALPALYTTQQAKAGKRVFENKCVTCHGENMQGKSAPSVAGKDFLEVANRNGWTLNDLRNVIVYNMPFNDPGTLTKHQYAEVMAYLLAANCYPAGDKPFPEYGNDALAKLRVESPDKMHPSEEKLGVCSVN